MYTVEHHPAAGSVAVRDADRLERTTRIAHGIVKTRGSGIQQRQRARCGITADAATEGEIDAVERAVRTQEHATTVALSTCRVDGPTVDLDVTG